MNGRYSGHAVLVAIDNYCKHKIHVIKQAPSLSRHGYLFKFNDSNYFQKFQKCCVPPECLLFPPNMLTTLTVAKLEDELEAPDAALGDPPAGRFSMRSCVEAS